MPKLSPVKTVFAPQASAQTFYDALQEIANDLPRKLEQLHAALLQCSGDGFDAFDSMSETTKHAYLCMLADLAESAVAIAEPLPRLYRSLR